MLAIMGILTINWLVVEPPTPLKNMTNRQIGMMTFSLYRKIKFMFQTTNHTGDMESSR
jgi:hypothetical protein